MSEAGQLLARWRTTNQMGLTVCLLRKGGFGPSMGQCSERGFALVGGVFFALRRILRVAHISLIQASPPHDTHLPRISFFPRPNIAKWEMTMSG